MPESKKSPLENLAEQLPTLLKKLERSLGDDATASDQAQAFELGCSLLNDLIKLLEQPDSPIWSLDNAKGFGISILGDGLEQFLKQEKELLQRYKLEPKQIDRILALLTAVHKEGETRDLQADAKQVIDSLSQLREIVCAIKVFAQEGHKIPNELVGACYDSMLDVAVITGDTAVIPFSLAHGNPGGVVLGIASIGVGVRNLCKHVSRAKEFFISFRNSRKAADLKEKAPKKKLK
jgi:hypothetical protein